MDAYTGFAQVYDLFMDNVPYGEWKEYLVGLLREYGIVDGLVLDLGCGTGKMTRLLAEEGYDMIGVDGSCEMLEIAVAKQQEAESSAQKKILYLMQDMREFELYGTVRAVVCVCDTMNYMLEEEDFLAVLKLVDNYLDPGGIFIFDLNTSHKFREEMGNTTISENRAEGSFIWENEYDDEERINEYHLTLYVRDEGQRDEELYRRFEEWHYERAYEAEAVAKLVREAGMELVAVYDAFSREPAREDSGRICVVAREIRKK